MSTSATADKKTEILDIIRQQGVLPLFYNKSEEVSINVLRALYAAGIRTVEYTNRGEAALQNFSVLRRVCDAELTGMQLGIGTIKTGDEAKAFVDAGADYLISPGVVKAAAKVAQKAGVLYVPGCMTPTEIIKAEGYGATLMKIFPGNILGPGYITAIREIFPALNFMVTGGVEPEEQNLRAWFSAGVTAVGMGSKLITKQILESQEYSQITTLTQEALYLIQTIRS
ncbi:MAG: bifunctional 4-hydroxy-2-oxoglutarate aldolase/2-dehydro-3-deoxy-phosphogluconate aldolase [Bacteroidota bacterium]|nr:bifunctional 4-hydroxy-2-oxoglutarate aldolase/2-dehydro-3-deoxy-phosphogluconate aldolase [Bacteroidota bacterium]